MLVPGALLHGRYQIERHLEEGGMSVVYAAWDRSLSARVAVKEMKAVFQDEADKQRAVDQFRAEASILANLVHAGLPRVTNYFNEGDTSYLVMDYIQGDSLNRALNRYGRFPEPRLAAMWAYEICEVLDYLHNRTPSIIFRDLKPSNVMLTYEGHVKLIDFGISKIFDQSGEGATRTVIKGAGTPGYQPPEQYALQGGTRTDARSDIYALGATLYSILTFQIPIESIDRLVSKVPLVPVRELNPEVDEALDALVAKLMQPDMDERPPSAAVVMEALEKLIGGVPPRGRIPLPAGMLRPPSGLLPSYMGPSQPPPPEDEGEPTEVPVRGTKAPMTTMMPVSEPVRPAPHTVPTILASVPSLVTVPQERKRGKGPWVVFGGVVVAALAIGGLLARSSTTPSASTPSPSAVAVVLPQKPSPSPSPQAAKPTVVLTVTPPQAKVYALGVNAPEARYELQTRDADGTYKIRLPLPVRIKLTCGGFCTVEREIGVPATKFWHLTPIGKITIKGTTVAGVEVEPQQVSLADGFTVDVPAHKLSKLPATLELPPAKYRVHLKPAPGYLSATQTVEVKPGAQTMSLVAEPVPVVHVAPPVYHERPAHVSNPQPPVPHHASEY